METSKKEKDPHEIEIIKNKDKYISLNENTDNIKDVTNDIISKLNQMTEGQMISTKDFSLHDTMSALELNHIKMDPHYHNETVKTYKTLIREGKIKNIDKFTIDESLILINDLFKREITWLYGGILQQDIFSFIYLSDPLIDNYIEKPGEISLVKTFLNSIFHLIYVAHRTYSDWSCLREEDISIVYFTNIVNLKRENCLNEIKNIENFLKNTKNEYNKNIINQLLNRFKIQRIIISLITEQFDINNINRYDNIVIYMNELKGEINLIDFTIENKQIDFNIDYYFNLDLVKIIPNFSNNKYKIILTSEQTIAKLNDFVSSLNSLSIIYTKNNYFHLMRDIINFCNTSQSFILNLFLDINLFSNNKLFNKYDVKESICEIMKKLKFDINDEEILSYFISSRKDILKAKLKNKQRQIRECKDLIDNLTAIAFMCRKKENDINPNASLSKSVLTNYALKTLLNEMHYILKLNFALSFFQPYELDFVFYVCEMIMYQMSMPNLVLSTRYAEKILKSENIAANTAKKKFSQYQKMLLDEIYIYDALKKVYSSLKLLFVYLKEKNLIKFPMCNDIEEKLRIENRFPYFKSTLSFSNLNYGSFKENIKNEKKDDGYILKQSDNIKSGIKMLNELKKAEQKLRDFHSYDNDYIGNMSKALMANCLIFGKLAKLEKTLNNDKKYIDVTININKYDTFIPVIELK